jgi:hypothetical protein
MEGKFHSLIAAVLAATLLSSGPAQAGEARSAAGRAGGEVAPVRSFVVEVPDQEARSHPVRCRLRDLRSTATGSGRRMAATVETELGAVLQLTAEVGPRGAQTLRLIDPNGRRHQIVLNAKQFRMDYPIEDVDRSRAVDVGGKGDLLEILSDPAFPAVPLPATAYMAFPLHRLLVEAVKQADPENSSGHAILEKAVAFVASAFPVDTVTGATDEWKGLNALLSKTAPRQAQRQEPQPKERRGPEEPPQCLTEKTVADRNGSLNLPIPGVATVTFEGVAASVHAKCRNDADDCLQAAGGTGNINVLPLAAIPECNKMYRVGQGGEVLLAATAKGTGEARVEKGRCAFQADDYAVIAGLTVTIGGGAPLTTSASKAEGDTVCAAAKAKVDVKACVGRQVANGFLIPSLISDIAGKTNTNCQAIQLP